MEHNRNRDSSGKIHRNRESQNISINFNYIRQKSSSQNNQHNGWYNHTQQAYTINKNTQVADFSVVAPQQSKFIKPVDTAIHCMIPEGDPDLITYLTELLRTNKPDQQNNTFRFPTHENPGNIEDHTPIKTRIVKELHELQLKETNWIRKMTWNHEWNI